MTERWRTLTSRPWVHCLLLAIPFLVGVFVLKCLTVTLPVDQGLDEAKHYAAVLEFARQLPFVDLSRAYGTSNGPLMYYVYGAFVAFWGPGIVKLRLLNTLVSYLTTVAMYLMFRRTLSSPPSVSLALAALVGFSPFLFGQTFVVLSDNFMYLWMVLALDFALRFARKPALPPLVVSSLFTALALLTRQFAIWLVPVTAFAVWHAPAAAARKWGWLAVVAASCVPLALVMVAWGGPVQPGSESMLRLTDSRLANLLQALTVAGFFVLTVVPIRRIKAMASEAIHSPLLIGVALAALVGLWFGDFRNSPLTYGYFGRFAAAYPAMHGTGVVYWILAPLGAVFASWAVSAYRADRTKWLASIGFALLALTTLASAVTYQRYVDVPFLLCLSVLASGDEQVHRLDFVRWWLLAAAFIGYVSAYARP